MVDPRTSDPLASDPIGTVRVHPEDDPMALAARRRIKVDASDHSGPYERACWYRLTTTYRPGSPFGLEDGDPAQSEYVLTWPVQPWWQLAAVLELPSGREEFPTLMERRSALREEWQDILTANLGSSHLSQTEVTNAKKALARNIAESILGVERERDQAIAHDRQPYPTAWSYEKLSEIHSELVEGLKRQLEPLVGKEAFDEHPGHQGLLEILGQVCTEAKLGHQMSEMLLERDYERGPQGLADFFSEVAAARANWLDKERALTEAQRQPFEIQVPDEVEQAMLTGIRGWLDTEDVTRLRKEQLARGAAGAAYAVLESGDLVLAPRLRSGPLVRLVVALPPNSYISDVYARFRAAGFELRLAAEPEDG